MVECNWIELRVWKGCSKARNFTYEVWVQMIFQAKWKLVCLVVLATSSVVASSWYYQSYFCFRFWAKIGASRPKKAILGQNRVCRKVHFPKNCHPKSCLYRTKTHVGDHILIWNIDFSGNALKNFSRRLIFRFGPQIALTGWNWRGPPSTGRLASKTLPHGVPGWETSTSCDWAP